MFPSLAYCTHVLLYLYLSVGVSGVLCNAFLLDCRTASVVAGGACRVAVYGVGVDVSVLLVVLDGGKTFACPCDMPARSAQAWVISHSPACVSREELVTLYDFIQYVQYVHGFIFRELRYAEECQQKKHEPLRCFRCCFRCVAKPSLVH